MKPNKSERWTGIAATGVGVLLGTICGAALGVFAALSAAVVRGARAGSAPPTALPEPAPLRPGWSRPKPAYLVKPTYWPMVLALGIAFLLWGLISNPFVSTVGLVLFVLALANWIRELRHEP